MKKTLLIFSILGIIACKPKENKETEKNIESVDSVLVSHLEILNVNTGERTEVYSSKNHFEAPTWTPDGTTLIYNSQGKLYSIPVNGKTPTEINTDFATKCNNDHLISPDGKMLAISHHTKEDNQSRIYTLPITGGVPKLVTENAPSYLHGWSPDGKSLAYCADRNGNYDIYSIDTSGGVETRLTEAKGLDDGPEYCPDGKHIYFNSVRTGTMQIWRMKADGSEEVQVTTDEYHDWFAHISPDNKKIVYISYEPSVEGHPANKNVMLRMMPVKGGDPVVLLHLFGGQGTINVPSWSPDSKKIAFVRYEFVNK